MLIELSCCRNTTKNYAVLNSDNNARLHIHELKYGFSE